MKNAVLKIKTTLFVFIFARIHFRAPCFHNNFARINFRRFIFFITKKKQPPQLLDLHKKLVKQWSIVSNVNFQVKFLGRKLLNIRMAKYFSF